MAKEIKKEKTNFIQNSTLFNSLKSNRMAFFRTTRLFKYKMEHRNSNGHNIMKTTIANKNLCISIITPAKQKLFAWRLLLPRQIRRWSWRQKLERSRYHIFRSSCRRRERIKDN